MLCYYILRCTILHDPPPDIYITSYELPLPLVGGHVCHYVCESLERLVILVQVCGFAVDMEGLSDAGRYRNFRPSGLAARRTIHAVCACPTTRSAASLPLTLLYLLTYMRVRVS